MTKVAPSLKSSPPLPSTAMGNRAIALSTAPRTEELNVLVINASQDMAKEITLQLTLALPGCSITYAPTIELARWILGRKKIDLVVSSPVLPDGGISRLKEALKKLSSPPDVVVVGDPLLRNAEIFNDSNYELATSRRFEPSHRALPPPPPPPQASVDDRLKMLGADLRNDLNNPLQEIVAMVFVARAGASIGPGTSQALHAIEAAAGNMANVVRRLEEKIRSAVGS